MLGAFQRFDFDLNASDTAHLLMGPVPQSIWMLLNILSVSSSNLQLVENDEEYIFPLISFGLNIYFWYMFSSLSGIILRGYGRCPRFLGINEGEGSTPEFP